MNPNGSIPSKRIRILQVVGAMRRGGAEVWLMRVLRGIDKDRFRIDFLVHDPEEGELEPEIRELGSCVHRQVIAKRNVKYPSSLVSLLRSSGPWDCIHSHEHQFSGVILWAARQAGIRRRIAHCHTDTSLQDRLPNLPRLLYRKAMSSLVWNYATDGISCSRQAAPSVFGSGWKDFPNIRILPCGFNLADFSRRPDVNVRMTLGLPSDCSIVGHVGRFDTPKNHALIVQMAAVVRNRKLPYHFLLVGDGKLKGSIEQEIKAKDLSAYITLLASRPDVGRMMSAAMDYFVFPSIREGMPVALLEAQASMLPCLISTRVPLDANVFPEDNIVLDVLEPAHQWVDALLKLRTLKVGQERHRHDRLRALSFDMDASLDYLQRLYGGEL